MVLFVIIGFISVSALQIIHFYKKKQYGEIAVYSVLMASALVYAISGLTDWDFPAPTKIAEMIFEPFSDYIFGARLKK